MKATLLALAMLLVLACGLFTFALGFFGYIKIDLSPLLAIAYTPMNPVIRVISLGAFVFCAFFLVRLIDLVSFQIRGKGIA